MRTEWGLLANQVGSSARAVPADDDVLHVNTVGTRGQQRRLLVVMLRVIYVLLKVDFSDDGGPQPSMRRCCLCSWSWRSSQFHFRGRRLRASKSSGWSASATRLLRLESRRSGKLERWNGPRNGQQRSRFGKVLSRMLRDAYFLSWPSTSGKALLLGADVRRGPVLALLGLSCGMPLVVNLTLALVSSKSQQRCMEGLRGHEGCCWRGLPHRSKTSSPPDKRTAKQNH